MSMMRCAASSDAGTRCEGARARHKQVLRRAHLRRTGRAAATTGASWPTAVCYTLNPVGEPDAGNRHVRFDERGWKTERLPNGSSHRVHPRLYPLNPGYSSECVRFLI